ncbi:HlyD family secretion protein [Oceanicola sp. 502str15]|uniref:HlyD family secretion protein n=1 Tax=Oceanicola sp. 502str15 TaxID=2696061 RepID=UPI0020945004|nr:HlyD family efflux transporter periplasmic adaptor subunit [Oceanicola sp. 502str15]MCO6384337.1 HlyD family efflux transporter periplasmic adaptor subunit [Oceanicola sp. 502str15]
MSILCAIPILSALFAGCAPPLPFATGYVEGEYTLVAPIASAQVRSVAVSRGDSVVPGDLLVEMESRDAEIALAQAEAALAQAQNELANLTEGQRPEEMRVLEATLASTRAREAEAEREAARMAQLAERGAATAAQRDDAQTAAEVARAAVAEAEARLAVARLPARAQQIAAAQAQVDGASAARDQAEWALSQRRLTAPVAGQITDIIRIAGENAGPSAPVLSLLGESALKLRLYVPETSVSRVAPGARLTVNCDGCASGLTATVNYVAEGPEFTPPVIYSLENRQKLVYLVEARPDGGAASLKPGQIVDVDLPGTTGQ